MNELIDSEFPFNVSVYVALNNARSLAHTPVTHMHGRFTLWKPQLIQTVLNIRFKYYTVKKCEADLETRIRRRMRVEIGILKYTGDKKNNMIWWSYVVSICHGKSR